MHAALSGARKELRATGGGVMQSIHGAVSPPGAFVLDQGLDVWGIFDLRPAIEAARVHGNDLGAIHDAHAAQRGQDLEGAAYTGVRDRVVVQIEAHVGRLGGPHDDPFLAGEGLGG